MMSDKPLNKGPQDMGGEKAGPIDTTDHGMKFWKRQANAFRSAVQASKINCTDGRGNSAQSLIGASGVPWRRTAGEGARGALAPG